MSELSPESQRETSDASPAAPGDKTASAPRIPGHEVLEKIGEGGMGVVFKARQLAADRVVAVKAIKRARCDDAAALARFRNEARRIALVRHSHVIQIHEVGEADGRPYFTMEFCPGGSLDAKLAGTPLPPKEAAALVESLARAVQAAHDHGVIHRDLKPANVLLAADGAPRITDFGLAKQLDDDADSTVSRAVLGTPSYMAPEQTLGKAGAAGPAADVYALGAILYECLTGRPPFLAATVVDTLLLVRTAAPAAPAQLQPKTPRDLETICLKCLRKEPGQRYGSAAALAEDLRRFRAGEPIAARAVGAAERLVKWGRRRPTVAALLVGLIAVLAAGTAVSTNFAVEAGRRAAQADASASQARENEKITREKTTLIRQREEAANQARQEADATTARGLLRTLAAQPTGPADDVEMDALWGLAESRGDSTRMRFLDEALDSPERARPLMGRRELALHAAVGLDSERRRRLEEKLRAVLRDEQADPELRADCAAMGAALGERDGEFAHACILALAEAPVKAGPPSPLIPRPGGLGQPNVLTGLAQHLDHAGAADAARALAQAMKQTNDAATMDVFAFGLAAVLDRLPPDERAGPAEEAAHALADAMTAAPQPTANVRGLTAVLRHLPPGEAGVPARDAARALTASLGKASAQPQDWVLVQTADALAELSDWLDPQTATEAAHALSAAMGRMTNAYQLGALDLHLAALLARLPPEQRAAGLQEAGRAAAAVVTRELAKPNGGTNLLDPLTTVADQLDGDAAADVAHALIEAMARSSNDYEKGAIAKALQVVVSRLDAAHATALAQSLAGDLAKAPSLSARGVVAQELGIVLDRLPPGDAAKMAGEAAQPLADALCGFDHFQSADPQAPQALANGIIALTRRLDAHDQATLARRFADAVTRTPNSNAVLGMAEVLGSISDRLNSEDACDVAEALAVVMARYGNNTTFLDQAVKGFSAVCARLGPADAPYITRALADALARNPFIPDSTVKAAAARLDHDGATAVADALAAAMVRRTNAGQEGVLARVLAVVLGDLPADEAARRTGDAARRLTDAMKKNLDETAAADAANQWSYAAAFESMASAWAALLDRLPPDEAAPLVRGAARALADAMKKAADQMTSPDAVRKSAGVAVLERLAPTLSAVLKRLPPDEAGKPAADAAHALADAMQKAPGSTRTSACCADAAHALADAMQRAGDLPTKSALAPLLAAALERLPADEAAPLARDGVRGLMDVGWKAADANGLADAAVGAGALLRFLPREEAAPLTKEAVRALAGRLKAIRAIGFGATRELDPLMRGLAGLAPRLDHDDLVLIVCAAADALAEISVPQDRETLAKSLTRLMTTWDQDAADTAEALTDAADPDAAGFVPLTETLAALVVRLKPEEVPAKAPRLLAEALARTTDRNASDDFRGALEACAARLDHDGAAAVARRLAAALSADPAADGADNLAHALGAVLDRLPPEDAEAIARQPAQVLTDAWKKNEKAYPTGSAASYYRPTRALLLASARTNGLEVDERLRFISPDFPVRRTVALFGSSPDPFAAPAVLALVAQPPQSRLSMQDLVDLLKRPNCVGATADVILEELGGRCGQRFDNLWDFVDWAEKNRPDLDLKSPPHRELP